MNIKSISALDQIKLLDDIGQIDLIISETFFPSQDHDELIKVGISWRDQGYIIQSQRLFSYILRHLPDSVPALYETAFIHRLGGEHYDAVRLLRRARRLEPRNVRVLLFCAHMMYAVGLHKEANDELEYAAIIGTVKQRRQIESMWQFGAYLKAWPLSRALSLLDDNVSVYKYQDILQVAERILMSIDTRRPFCLLRLGDGEGGCINFDKQEERQFDALYASNRSEVISMWFGPNFDAAGSGFLELSQSIVGVALSADVVGLPYENWIRHEYRISSLRGIPTLVNIHRAFGRAADIGAPTTLCCTQQIHVELFLGGHLARIIERAQGATVISCLEELPALMRGHFGVSDINLLRIPGEQGSASILGEVASRGTHYPDAYSTICSELDRPHNGRVFLVAAGILGKFYAMKIKQNGGIAIDIGSVVDGWARKHTRPGMSNEIALALQP